MIRKTQTFLYLLVCMFLLEGAATSLSQPQSSLKYHKYHSFPEFIVRENDEIELNLDEYYGPNDHSHLTYETDIRTEQGVTLITSHDESLTQTFPFSQITEKVEQLTEYQTCQLATRVVAPDTKYNMLSGLLLVCDDDHLVRVLFKRIPAGEYNRASISEFRTVDLNTQVTNGDKLVKKYTLKCHQIIVSSDSYEVICKDLKSIDNPENKKKAASIVIVTINTRMYSKDARTFTEFKNFDLENPLTQNIRGVSIESQDYTPKYNTDPSTDLNNQKGKFDFIVLYQILSKDFGVFEKEYIHVFRKRVDGFGFGMAQPPFKFDYSVKLIECPILNKQDEHTEGAGSAVYTKFILRNIIGAGKFIYVAGIDPKSASYPSAIAKEALVVKLDLITLMETSISNRVGVEYIKAIIPSNVASTNFNLAGFSRFAEGKDEYFVIGTMFSLHVLKVGTTNPSISETSTFKISYSGASQAEEYDLNCGKSTSNAETVIEGIERFNSVVEESMYYGMVYSNLVEDSSDKINGMIAIQVQKKGGHLHISCFNDKRGQTGYVFDHEELVILRDKKINIYYTVSNNILKIDPKKLQDGKPTEIMLQVKDFVSRSMLTQDKIKITRQDKYNTNPYLKLRDSDVEVWSKGYNRIPISYLDAYANDAELSIGTTDSIISFKENIKIDFALKIKKKDENNPNEKQLFDQASETWPLGDNYFLLVAHSDSGKKRRFYLQNCEYDMFKKSKPFTKCESNYWTDSSEPSLEEGEYIVNAFKLRYHFVIVVGHTYEKYDKFYTSKLYAIDAANLYRKAPYEKEYLIRFTKALPSTDQNQIILLGETRGSSPQVYSMAYDPLQMFETDQAFKPPTVMAYTNSYITKIEHSPLDIYVADPRDEEGDKNEIFVVTREADANTHEFNGRVNVYSIKHTSTGSIDDNRLIFKGEDAGMVYCPMEDEIYMWNPMTNTIHSRRLNRDPSFTYRAHSNYSSLYTYPLAELKVDRVLDFNCITQKRVLQILGQTTEKKKLLITYRGGIGHDLNKRVHSTVEVDQAATSIHTATLINSDTIIVGLDVGEKEPGEREIILINVNGPFVWINTEKLTGTSDIKIEIGSKGASNKATTAMKIIVSTEIKTERKFKTGVKLTDLEAGIRVNLTDYFEVKGPVMDIQLQNFDKSKIEFTPRRNKTDAFGAIDQTIFSEIIATQKWTVGRIFNRSKIYLRYFNGEEEKSDVNSFILPDYFRGRVTDITFEFDQMYRVMDTDPERFIMILKTSINGYNKAFSYVEYTPKEADKVRWSKITDDEIFNDFQAVRLSEKRILLIDLQLDQMTLRSYILDYDESSKHWKPDQQHRFNYIHAKSIASFSVVYSDKKVHVFFVDSDATELGAYIMEIDDGIPMNQITMPSFRPLEQEVVTPTIIACEASPKKPRAIECFMETYSTKSYLVEFVIAKTERKDLPPTFAVESHLRLQTFNKVAGFEYESVSKGPSLIAVRYKTTAKQTKLLSPTPVYQRILQANVPDKNPNLSDEQYAGYKCGWAVFVYSRDSPDVYAGFNCLDVNIIDSTQTSLMPGFAVDPTLGTRFWISSYYSSIIESSKKQTGTSSLPSSSAPRAVPALLSTYNLVSPTLHLLDLSVGSASLLSLLNLQFGSPYSASNASSLSFKDLVKISDATKDDDASTTIKWYWWVLAVLACAALVAAAAATVFWILTENKRKNNTTVYENQQHISQNEKQGETVQDDLEAIL